MFNWKASGTKTLPLLQNEFKLIVIVCVENRPKAFMTTENEMVKLNSFSFDKMRDASKYQIRWNHSPCPFLFLFFVSLSLSHTYSLSACVKWWISNFNHIKLFFGCRFLRLIQVKCPFLSVTFSQSYILFFLLSSFERYVRKWKKRNIIIKTSRQYRAK